MDDEIGNLIKVANRCIVVLDELRGRLVWVLGEVVGEFEGRFAIFHINVEYIIVFLSVVLSLAPTAPNRIHNRANIDPLLLG